MRFELFRVRSFSRQRWRWRLRAGNGRIVATSGERFANRGDALHGIALVRATGPLTRVHDLTTGDLLELPSAAPTQ